jgi:hypothetical protein
MSSLAIIEAFDVIEDLAACLGTADKVCAANQTDLQVLQAEEQPRFTANPSRELLGYQKGGIGADHREWLKIEQVQSPDGRMGVVTNVVSEAAAHFI